MEAATTAEIFPPGGYPLEEEDDDFQITHKELDQLKEALKDANFRKLLSEYVEDVQSPESQTTYQKEVTQLEKERGNTVHFLNPIPGYVIKTSVNGEKKAFINICSNPSIRKLNCESSYENGKKGVMWSIPYAQSPPREDLDKAGKMCMVYDVIFNPTTIIFAQKHPQLRAKLDSTAIDAVEKNFNVTLDKNNIRKPKAKFKGMVKATVIKYQTGENPPDILDLNGIKEALLPQPKEIYSNSKTGKPSNKTRSSKKDHPLEANAKSCEAFPKKIIQEESENFDPDNPAWKQEKMAENYTEPIYKLKYRSHVDMQDYCFDNQREGRSSKPIPQEIQLTIDLPMLKESSTIDADVVEDGQRFELKSTGKIKYHLNLKLPFPVRPEAVKASFDKDKRKLCVNMKTVQKKYSCATSRLDPEINLVTANPFPTTIIQCLDEDDIEQEEPVSEI